MINLVDYLFNKIKPIIQGWDEQGIYAISFFVQTNEATGNIPSFAISYNTEEDCGFCPPLSEERWNYAFWRQNENLIIGNVETIELLLNWFKQNNIENIGQEDRERMYDVNYNYIGNGPNGKYEFIQAVTEVAKRLHNEEVLLNSFGTEIPIIIHDLEYAWYELEATRNANPPGLADMFLKTIGS